jgi:hypothetical protein
LAQHQLLNLLHLLDLLHLGLVLEAHLQVALSLEVERGHRRGDRRDRRRHGRDQGQVPLSARLHDVLRSARPGSRGQAQASPIQSADCADFTDWSHICEICAICGSILRMAPDEATGEKGTQLGAGQSDFAVEVAERSAARGRITWAKPYARAAGDRPRVNGRPGPAIRRDQLLESLSEVCPTRTPNRQRAMHKSVNVNPTSEHALYLRLFVTNGGGW